ncbi:MAG: hypothetical protein KA184_11925 [Candidatus Hydrogenedentes bacterium]|nr:hypothetical protein [Candidatus Hydrogenedentota bacterium]
MIKDKIIRLKLRKGHQGQKPWNFVGKVTAVNDHWLVMEARGIMLSRQQPQGVEIDKKPSAMMFPRESIESIRILPDSFNVTDLKVTTEGQKLMLVVEGAADAFLGEMGEG